MDRFVRRHFADEEPDVDERSYDEFAVAELLHGHGLCERCGQRHDSRMCPHVGAEVYRRPWYCA